MGKRLLLNLLLAVMVAGLAALVWLKSNETVETSARNVSELARDSVTNIEIRRPDFPDLAFNNVAGKWLLAGEPAAPADDFQVDTILALLDASTERFYPATGLDLTGMGLVPPKASLKLNDKTFVIGDVEPIDKRRYVLAGDTVFLLEDRYQHFINAGRNNFIERQLVPKDSTITGLQLPGIALELGSDKQWQLTPNNSDTAIDDISADAIRGLVARWQQVQALYVTDSKTDKPSGDEVLITLENTAEPIRLIITIRQPDLVLSRPDYGIRYHITGETAASLLKLPPPTNKDL